MGTHPIFESDFDCLTETNMGVKKRVPSKTDQQPVAPSRETSVSDLGFTITGQLEVDFPEGMRKHCDPAPLVILVDEKQADEDASTVDVNTSSACEGSVASAFEEKRPRLYAIQRSETEGKNVIKHVVGIQIKNWHFRPADAKVLSHCLEKHEKLESVQLIKTKLTSNALNELALPSSVKFLSIHSNDMSSDPQLINAIMNKGIAHIGLQYNSMGEHECEAIARALRGNDHVVTLNLSGNRLGDTGAQLLARALLVNKKLAALSMQHCQLGDEAAESFGHVLSRQVEMTRDEIVQWRQSRMELLVTSNSSLQLTIKPTKQNRPGSENSGSQTGKESAGKSRKTKVEKAPEKGLGKGGKPKRTSNSNIAESKNGAAPSPKLPDHPQVPDETGIVRQNGKMYAPGNRTLYSLNLSGNKIGRDGLFALLTMLNVHYEAEQQTGEVSTSLLHLKLDNNIYSNLQFNSQMRDHPKFGEIVSGVDGLFSTSKTSISRLDEIKEDNN